MTILKLLGRQVLSASEITFCGHLSERSKWKFPGLWPTVSFRSKSLWAWGVRGAQNFKLFSPGGRGHQVPCVYYQLYANHSTCSHDNKPQRVRVGPSFRWETWGSERWSNVINVINKLEFEALPKKSQGWSPLEGTGWISLQFMGLSRVFSNTTVQKHQFFGAQLFSQSNSHIHTWLLEKP